MNTNLTVVSGEQWKRLRFYFLSKQEYFTASIKTVFRENLAVGFFLLQDQIIVICSWKTLTGYYLVYTKSNKVKGSNVVWDIAKINNKCCIFYVCVFCWYRVHLFKKMYKRLCSFSDILCHHFFRAPNSKKWWV